MKPHVALLCIAGALVLAVGCSRKNESATALKGPRIVQDMIAAHGGMEAWKNAPTVSFTDQWGESAPRMAFVVEQSSRRAYFDIPGTATAGAWDGGKAWSVDWPTPTPVRFIALLNYYFVNLPWLTQDPGVILSEPGTGRLRDDSVEYVTVMMTFEPGTGDTPDDYYRLYIHPETKMLRACDYIVTYQALMGEGQTSTPEHCLVYDQMTPAEGVMVPSHFIIYEGEQVYAECSIGGYSLAKAFDESRMTMPEGAVVDASTP
ncbi:MAG: hypothetical protein L0Z51_01240 [Candidatus Latescibacteria bacterium]|nr:hypothetical protein [Candidatus Latescibacterota bacterium]